MAIKTFTTEGLTSSDINTFLTNSGLVFVSEAVGTAQNRLNLPTCFSSTFENYRVTVSGISTTTGDNIGIRFSTGGADTIGTAYTWQRIETNASASSSISGTSQSFISPTFITATTNTRGNMVFDVYGPQTANATSISGQVARLDSGSNLFQVSFAGAQLTTTSQFDGLTIFGGGGNLTCKVTVYGYRKA